MTSSSSVSPIAQTSILVGNKMLTRELTVVFGDAGPATKIEQLKNITSYFMTGDVRVTLFKHDYPTGREEFMTELFTPRYELSAYTQACAFVSSVIKLDRGDKVAAIKLSNETV